MRVVHLSTFESAGGAARAANGLHRALLAEGVDSRMLVMDRQSDDPSVHSLQYDRVDRRVAEVSSAHWCTGNRTGLSNTAYSLTFGGFDVSRHPEVLAAEVINLHWVPWLLDAAAIGRILTLGKPIVWTLHDEWAYTGGCHFTAGCNQWRTGCGDCPQLIRDPHGIVPRRFAEKIAAFASGGFSLVGPSRWIAGRAAESLLLRDSRVEVIPYGVDLEVFHPDRAVGVRARLGYSDEDFVVVFNAADSSEIRKGYRQFALALALLDHSLHAAPIRIVIMGASNGEAPAPGSQALGFLSRRQEIAEVIAACDLYVAPSLEDNLPNGVLEALACGTPCLGFDSGGIPDMLDEAPGSSIVPTGDTGALARAIELAWQRGRVGPELRSAVRSHAEARFSPGLQARRYAALYRSLVAVGVPA